MDCDGLKVDDIKALKTSLELREVLRDYNWDDGYEIPHAIAEHPQCELGIALELFWLAGAIAVYLNEVEPTPWRREWIDFCEQLTARILAGTYKPSLFKFEGGPGRVGAYKLRKRGVPEIFITGTTPDG